MEPEIRLVDQRLNARGKLRFVVPTRDAEMAFHPAACEIWRKNPFAFRELEAHGEHLVVEGKAMEWKFTPKRAPESPPRYVPRTIIAFA